MEDASFDIIGNCVVTVSRDEFSELTNGAPSARAPVWPRLCGRRAMTAVWAISPPAGWIRLKKRILSASSFTPPGTARRMFPNADLFLEDDLVALVGDRTPLPKPQASTYEEASSPEFLAKMQQWQQNNQAIEDLGTSYLTQQLDALSTRIGITDKNGAVCAVCCPGRFAGCARLTTPLPGKEI